MSAAITLADIEREFNFIYPALYKQMDKDGMLNVGEYRPNWYKEVFPKLKDNPTLLLHVYDFESLNANGVREAILELTDPDDYRAIKPGLRFIPFGQSGAGDHYCFFLNEQDGDDIPIAFVWHDSDHATMLARNLQDYIFKSLLTAMSDQDTYNNVSDAEFMDDLQSMLKTHSKYLTERQVGILQDMLPRKITDYAIALPNGRKEMHRGLLTETELEEILDEVIPYEKMGLKIPYSD